MIFPDLSVAENIFIGHRNRGQHRRPAPDGARGGRGAGPPRRPPRRRRAGPRSDPGRAADGRDRQGDLARRPRPDHGRADRLALGARGAPALPDRDRRCASEGVAVLFISHRMEEVFEIADRVTILRDGRWISTTPRAELTPAAAIRGMVGREVVELFRRERREPGAVRLAVRGSAPRGRLPRRLLRGARRRGARLRRAGRGAPHRRRSGALRDRPGRRRRRSSSTASPVTIASPRQAMALGHRLQHRGPPPARSGDAALDRRQHLAALAAAATSRRPGWCAARRSGRPPSRSAQRLQHPRALGRDADRRRSPAATSRRSSSASGWRRNRRC